MTAWFGVDWGAPVCRQSKQIPVPVGQACVFCEEVFLPNDCGLRFDCGSAYHLECNIRLVVGSVGHQKMRCSCYGGTEEDPPGMTRRQAANASYNLFLVLHEMDLDKLIAYLEKENLGEV